jgi:hypothetical protein
MVVRNIFNGSYEQKNQWQLRTQAPPIVTTNLPRGAEGLSNVFASKYEAPRSVEHARGSVGAFPQLRRDLIS